MEQIFDDYYENKFVAHGVYTVANVDFQVMLSDCNKMAKVMDAFCFDNPKISDWLEIQWVESEGESIIDPQGYNIPLSLVDRIDVGNAGYTYINKDGNRAHTWDFEESIGE